MAQAPQLNDSQLNLLAKIAANTGETQPKHGDGQHNLLFKIAQNTYASSGLLSSALQPSGDGYVLVQQGDDLAAKYAEAKAKSPSATNRVTLFIVPGTYSLSSELAIDAEYVDIVGLGAQFQSPAVIVTNNTLNVTANDVRVSGVSVGTQEFKIADNKPLQVFENCKGGDNSFAGNGGTASGTFVGCIGGDDSFGGYDIEQSSTASFFDCVAGNESFGGNAGDYPSAKYISCRITSGSFPTIYIPGRARFCLDDDYNIVNADGGYDSDAESYFTAAGVTDATAKEQLNLFVIGIKRLGLWDDMVCWPLRSAQNAGTGSTAYSLGGLGTLNGTLVNGPTWGADGIAFTESAESISLPLISAASAITASGGYSSFSVLNYISRSSANSNFINNLNTNIGGDQLFTDSASENMRSARARDAGERFTTQSLAAGSFVGGGFKSSFGCLKTDSTGFSIFNNQSPSTSVSTFGSAPIPPPFVDGTAGELMSFIGSPWTGDVRFAFAAFWLVPTTNQQAIDIRSLYVKTIGVGLGL